MSSRLVEKTRNFNVRLALPGSKSITNRGLLLAALSEGSSVLSDPLRSDDSEAFVGALNAMGASARWDGGNVSIDSPLPEAANGAVNCRDAGTAARFLPAAAAALGSTVQFDASHQMRVRPMLDLLNALRLQGAVTDPVDADHLPFAISSNGLSGGAVDLNGKISSQFLTGLLLASPLARSPLRLNVHGLVSRPYVDLTLAMMNDFGRPVERNGYESFSVTELGRYRAPDAYAIEADASTASYFFAAAVATESRVQVTNIRQSSMQGDIRLLQIFESMGATITDTPEGVIVQGPEQLHGVDVDMGDISDVMMTLACVAPLADSPTRITNVGHARVKESDRIAAVVEGLTRLGIDVEDGPDWIVIHPGAPKAASIDPHDDHRIAMSFSTLGLATGAVTIENPRCVIKTCPPFFDYIAGIEAAGGSLTDNTPATVINP